MGMSISPLDSFGVTFHNDYSSFGQMGVGFDFRIAGDRVVSRGRDGWLCRVRMLRGTTGEGRISRGPVQYKLCYEVINSGLYIIRLQDSLDLTPSHPESS